MQPRLIALWLCLSFRDEWVKLWRFGGIASGVTQSVPQSFGFFEEIMFGKLQVSLQDKGCLSCFLCLACGTHGKGHSSFLSTQGWNGQGESGGGGKSREPLIQELHTLLGRQIFQVRVKIQWEISRYKIYIYLKYKSRKGEFGKFPWTSVGRKEGGVGRRKLFWFVCWRALLLIWSSEGCISSLTYASPGDALSMSLSMNAASSCRKLFFCIVLHKQDKLVFKDIDNII